MAGTFEIVGKMMIGKESEKFKPYAVNAYDSGWVSTELKFNAVAGDNRHMLDIKGGHSKNNARVFSFSKSGKSDTGETIKGEKLQIPWEDRFKLDVIENVAEFKKFVIDLEEPKRRYKLEKALEKFKEGTLEEGELKELDVDNIEQAVEDSKKKRKEFIAESDFAEYIYKLISSGKIKDRMFKILGDITYSEYNGKFYKRMSPTRIYLAEKDAQPYSTGQMTVFFNKDSLDNSLLKKTQKYYVNAYVRDYDSQRKENVPCKISLTIDTSKNETDDKIKRLNNKFIEHFTVKDKSWKEMGVKVKLLDGSQKLEITEDMLTDLQKELLELDAITLDEIREEIRKETGGDVYGDPVREMIVINFGKGYSKGSKDTIYKNEDFVITPIEIVEKNDDNKKDDNQELESEEVDIFADLDI